MAFLHTNYSSTKFTYIRINALQIRLYEYIIMMILYTVKNSEGTIMDDFITTKEAAELWNISVRQVQNHCKNARIKGLL